MGDLIQFPPQDGWPTPEGNPPVIHVTPDNCQGTMHVFVEVPGPCLCGGEIWGPNGLEEPGTDAIGIHYVA